MLKTVLRELALHLVGTIVRVETDQPVAAISFDDGPNPDNTPKLLDILDLYNAKATFFVVGQRAAQYPELTQQIAKRGHVVGCHSWDHPSFPVLSSQQRRNQIKSCEKVIPDTGYRLFRPPFGHQTVMSTLDVRLLGYTTITWDVLVDDWLDHDAEKIYQSLMERIRPGSIILLHDALFFAECPEHLDRRPTIEAVRQFLSDRKEYDFVSVPELLRSGKPVKSIWRMQGDPLWLKNQKHWD